MAACCRAIDDHSPGIETMASRAVGVTIDTDVSPSPSAAGVVVSNDDIAYSSIGESDSIINHQPMSTCVPSTTRVVFAYADPVDVVPANTPGAEAHPLQSAQTVPITHTTPPISLPTATCIPLTRVPMAIAYAESVDTVPSGIPCCGALLLRTADCRPGNSPVRSIDPLIDELMVAMLRANWCAHISPHQRSGSLHVHTDNQHKHVCAIQVTSIFSKQPYGVRWGV